MRGRREIISYFSLPTDIAGEMRSWPEFLKGEDYSVELKDPTTGEEVAVVLIEDSENGGNNYVEIRSNSAGNLFDRVVGRAVFALAAHSDNLMVSRRVN